MNKGNIYIISAPSGAGKSSLIQALLSDHTLNDIKVSISYTTREMRTNEQNGIHYYFVSKKHFLSMIKNNDFIEHACVFNNFYGTSKKIVERIIKKKLDVILNIDWQGARQIKKQFSYTCSIFILPPSKEELFRRLSFRGLDKNDSILNRIDQSINEIMHCYEYDYIIVNKNFEQAVIDLKSIIFSDRLRVRNQIKRNNILFSKFNIY
ncbi:MAG: guanylate kinase [Arsenophonus sp.]|nr:MAG: guanylate kinase [Arsenophonus sp.]